MQWKALQGLKSSVPGLTMHRSVYVLQSYSSGLYVLLYIIFQVKLRAISLRGEGTNQHSLNPHKTFPYAFSHLQ